MRKRLYELGRELGLSSNEVLEALDSASISFEVPNHLTVLDDAQQDEVRRVLSQRAETERGRSRVGSGLVRRRHRVSDQSDSSTPTVSSSPRFATVTSRRGAPTELTQATIEVAKGPDPRPRRRKLATVVVRADDELPKPSRIPAGTTVSPELVARRDSDATAARSGDALAGESAGTVDDAVLSKAMLSSSRSTETTDEEGGSVGPPETRGDGFVGRLCRGLGGLGLEYSAVTVEQFILSLLAARDTGSLVLLAGPTGTGKTSLVRGVASVLEPAATGFVAVRPEWLSASDLLGYVNPVSDTYVPTDFVTQLTRAAHFEKQHSDGLFLLLLDEMNLARIENYGADLLAALPLRADDPERGLNLMSEAQLRLWQQERADHESDAERTPERGVRIGRLDTLFDLLPRTEGGDCTGRVRLPGNTVFCGTLNTDHHTHALSPKVLDRALVVELPPVDINALVRGSTAARPSAVVALPVPRGAGRNADEAREVRALVLGEALKALQPFGVSPSRRMAQLVDAMARWGLHLGLSTERISEHATLGIVVPKLDCRSCVELVSALEQLAEFSEQRGWGRVVQRLEELSRIAKTERVVRGLR